MKYFVALSFLVVATLAQTPCDIPTQFMSSISQVIKDGTGCQYSSIVGELYYDYENQQLRLDEAAQLYDLSFTETIWLDYNNQIGYYYDRDNNECTYDSIQGSLNSPNIPFDSSYNGDFFLGGQAVDSWTTPEEDGYVDVLAVTRDTCLPISVVTANATNGQALLTQYLTNVLPDLPPFYFDIPQICQTSKRSIGCLSNAINPFQYISSKKV